MTYKNLPTTREYQPLTDIESMDASSKPRQIRPLKQKQPVDVITVANAAESSRSQRRLEDFARLSSNWFWETDKNLRYCYLSDRFTAITGIPKSLVLDETVRNIGITEHDPDSWRAHLADMRNHRSFRNYTYSLVHPDGRTVVVSVDGNAIFDRTGAFLGYRGTGKDITHEVDAKEAVRQTRNLYQLAGRVAKLGYWEWDEVADKCIYCSDELARIHGVSVDDFLRISTSNEADRQWIHPDDRAKYEHEAQIFRNNLTGFEIEYRLLRANGTIAVVCEVVAPIVDNNGTLVRSIGFVKDVTEQRQRATALEEVASLYAQTENLAKIGHWEWDETTDRCLYCSAEMARLHGVTVEEYLQNTKSLADDMKWVHAEDRARTEKAFMQYIDHPAKMDVEYRMMSVCGRIRHIREVVAPILDCNGSLIRSIGYIQDISESKLAEKRLLSARDELEQLVLDRTAELKKVNEDLHEREKRLREAARIAKLGHFRWDDIGDKSMFYDDEMVRILDAPIEENATESYEEYLDRVHPEDRERVRATYEHRYTIGDSLDIEYRIVRPNGEIRHVRVVGDLVFDENEMNTQTFGTMQDITEQKVISRERAEVQAWLHELGSNSREVFWILSADWTKVIYISPAYEQVWGRTCESLLDDPMAWTKSVHPDDRDMVLAEMRAKIDGKDSSPDFSEYRIIRPDGSERWLSARAYPIRNDAGQIVRFAGFGEDITERKAAADVLRQVQKMEAVGQLTGGVAHDFNNLLAVILGNSELLQGDLATDNELLVREIILAGNRGAELTRRLLAFSRQQPLRPERIDINKLVTNMAELLRRTLGTTIVVDISLSPSTSGVLVDPNLLENAILNLALNARDAMPEGGTLSIRTNEERLCRSSATTLQNGRSEPQVSVTVQDDGIGMAHDVLSRALEPFFTTKEAGQGSGMGLPMVYGFAKQSSGDLAIESEKGKGTAVTLSLPCVSSS